MEAEIIPNDSTNSFVNTQEHIRDQDIAFAALKDLLLSEHHANITAQEARLNETIAAVEQIEYQIGDQNALVKVINPVIASSINTSIRENRDEMIDVLYPIIGSLIQRAVSEAMIDLKRQIDSQMSKAFNLEQLKHYFQSKLSGVSQIDSTIVASLPFEISSIFLIHRETGIPISYLSNTDIDRISDSDIVSGMLTAIRDFMSDVFSDGEGGNGAQLDEIQYGENRILIEPANHIYIALVTGGYVPHGFRSTIRGILFDIQAGYSNLLRNYDGNAVPFEPVRERLYNFMVEQNQRHSISVPIELRSTSAQPRARIGLWVNSLEKLQLELSKWSKRWLSENFHIVIPFIMLVLALWLIMFV